jgi:uncharacterized repeat protein (TIGR03803 family)
MQANPTHRPLARGSARAVGDSLWGTKAIEFRRRPFFEQLENRLLLSGYTLSDLGRLGVNATGANPHSGLVADSDGNLFGTTYDGGPYSVGTVFEIARGSNHTTTLAAFNGANGADPHAGLTLDASGNLYGTTQHGGAAGLGTVFEIVRGTQAITDLVSFDGVSSQDPSAGVTLDGAGNIYGTDGGSTVFEIASGTTTLTTIATLSMSVGGYLNGVAIDQAGNLFGTAYQGGAYGDGSVFEVAAGSHAATLLASFDKTNGWSPLAGVTLDPSGDIFGTTYQGGARGWGTVFEMASGTIALTTLASFNLTNGANPDAAVTLDASGNLYGTTGGGYNAVFEIAQGSGTITPLASFSQTNLVNAESPLMLDSAGNLYGTAYSGGTGGTGAVFEVMKGTNALSVLASFDGTNASNPYGSITLDGLGNLYGTTYNGGPTGNGTVFEIPAGTSTLTPLASFNWTNGANPQVGVTLDSSWNIYGTTRYGGVNGAGTVYEIAHGSGTIAVLASFSQSASPTGALAVDGSGDIYGTTSSTVFEIPGGSQTLTTLASFSGLAGLSGVTLDATGDLYGTTFYGGSSGAGTIFEIAKGSRATTTLASFDQIHGQGPQGGLVRDAGGNLYGATEQGGRYNGGVVFELANGSTSLTTLAAFNGATGYDPAAVSMDAAGNLYGTTSGSRETVFEIPRGSNIITTLVTFYGTNGLQPIGAPTPDRFGNLYGTTEIGVPDDAGTVFKLTTNTAVTLTLTSGANPADPTKPLAFTATVTGVPRGETVTGGVPDGGAVTLLDTSNNNAVVATATLSGGSATLTIPAGTLAIGAHDLIAVYGGDADFAASESAAYAQTVQVAPPAIVGAPMINGDNPNGLYTAPGQPNPGVQRSMVEDIVYTFSEPVVINDANAAFTVVGTGPHAGAAPSTLLATAVPGTNGTQWAVSLTGKADGVVASIANGEYSITLNPNAVFAANDGTTAMTTGRTDSFYRLFGDINGDRVVNVSDEFQFSKALNMYTPIFDVNGDGTVNLADEFQASKSFSSGGYVGDGFVTTI